MTPALLTGRKGQAYVLTLLAVVVLAALHVPGDAVTYLSAGAAAALPVLLGSQAYEDATRMRVLHLPPSASGRAEGDRPPPPVATAQPGAVVATPSVADISRGAIDRAMGAVYGPAWRAKLEPAWKVVGAASPIVRDYQRVLAGLPIEGTAVPPAGDDG